MSAPKAGLFSFLVLGVLCGLLGLGVFGPGFVNPWKNVEASAPRTEQTVEPAAPAVVAPSVSEQDDQQESADSDPAPAEEVGPDDVPGAQQGVPGDQILADLRNERPNGDDFRAPYSQREYRVLGEEFQDYLIAHSNEPNIKAMARSIGVAGVDNGVELAAWLDDNAEVRATYRETPRAMNTYFDNGRIVDWKIQTFPKDELFVVKYVNGEPIPLFKYVCGNVIKLLPRAATPAPVAPAPVAPAPVSPAEDTPEPTTPVAPEPIPAQDTDTPDEDTSDEETPPADEQPPAEEPPADEEPPTETECADGQTGTYPDCVTPEEPNEPKPDQTEECMQNSDEEDCALNEVVQESQDNETSDIDTDMTPGASSDAPPVHQPMPHDNSADGDHANEHAPLPSDEGSDSGSDDGSGTPHDSHGDDNGTSVSDDEPTSDPISEPDTGDSDNGYNDDADSGVIAMPTG